MPQDSSLNADHDHKKFSGLRGSKVFLAKNGAVATEHPIASMAAIDILRAGGNAVDAAVTASFCLTVTQPHLSGLGGDFFALYYDAKSGKVHCLNSSGWAPSGLTTNTIRSEGHTGIPLYGPYSVVVPGYARSWKLARTIRHDGILEPSRSRHKTNARRIPDAPRSISAHTSGDQRIPNLCQANLRSKWSTIGSWQSVETRETRAQLENDLSRRS